jgi:hypothetical protein
MSETPDWRRELNDINFDPEAVATRELAHDRAIVTYNALQDNLLVSKYALYRNPRNRPPHFAHLWPYSNALHATCTLAMMPDGLDLISDCNDRGDGLLAYTRNKDSDRPLGLKSSAVFPLGRGGDVYYDDNNWAALGLVQLFELTSDPKWLETAERILAFVQSGWSQDTKQSHPGGIRWAEPRWSKTRNTVSTAPAAELAAELYRITHKEIYLEWAIRCHDWVTNTLVKEDNLYIDNINPDGSYDHTVWSYNQGAMIGAGILIYGATGDKRFANQAISTAVAAVQHFSNSDILDHQGAAFNAIFFRNLFLLGADMPDSARSIAQDYCERQWNLRDQRTGLYPPVWDVNSTAPMIEIEALLAGSSPRP